MNILVENTTGKYQSRVDYVIDFINGHPACPDDVKLSSDFQEFDLKIQYGGESNSENHLVPAQQKIFSEDVNSTKSLFGNKYQWKDQSLFSVEEMKQDERNFIVDNVFQFDLFEMIFFHVSRYEEYHCDNAGKDRWDMMKEADQFLVKYKIEKSPVVDELVISFLEAIGVKPIHQKTKFRITHDIDLIKKFKSPLSFLRFNAYYLKNWKGVGSIKNLWGSYYKNLFANEVPYDVFDEMLIGGEQDREIYFLVGGKAAVDTPLNTKSEVFKKAIKLSKERGYKIGIHPSYETWKDGHMLRQEKEMLENIIEEEITISRQHYLHFDFDQTISILEEAGIKQDSTIGYNRTIGFRAGTGVGFKLYDHKNDRASRIIEKPLALMDSSLFDESKCDATSFLEIANKFIDENKFGTEITCNFHNSRFDDANMFDLPQEEVYAKLTNV